MSALASFSQTISGKYGVKNYQDTKNTYDWILKAAYEMKDPPTKVDTDFQFRVGDISCSCNTIEQFSENAYGAHTYSLINMRVIAKYDIIGTIYLSVSYSNEVYISAGSKLILEEIVKLLNNVKLNLDETIVPTSIVYVENQDNSITVNGDSNIIANNHSTIMDKQEKPESNINKWLQGVFQGLSANAIWKILGILAAAIIVYIARKSM